MYFQQKELVAYAKAQGHTEIKIYADNGFSDLPLNRSQFNNLQVAISASEISTVIVKNFSRIGRNFVEVAQWVRKIDEIGVTVVSLTEPSDLLDIRDVGFLRTWRTASGRISANREKCKNLSWCGARVCMIQVFKAKNTA